MTRIVHTWLLVALLLVLGAARASAAVTLSGNVFEDVTYSGGAGRTKAAASGVNRSGARVELYSSTGAFTSSTTTDASGNYSFSVAGSASYTIRVVNSTVTSSLGGTGLLPVQTFRTTATTGAAVAVTDRVGGENPTKADAGNGISTLAALTTATLTPQSITAVTAGTSNVTGLDFGFSFSTIVNTANSGQGSLRQFITNASALTGAQSSVFMISDGAAHPGLRAGLTNQLTSGVAVITLTSALPQITATLTLDGTSQTTNVGNTNAGTLGTGGTVGVDALALSTVNRPEVELSVPTGGAVTRGLDLAANNIVIRGLAIHGCGNGTNQTHANIHVASGTGITITQNVLGTTATVFAVPAVNPSANACIYGASGTSVTVSNNLIGFSGLRGVNVVAGATGWQVFNNEVRGCGISGASRNGGLELLGSGHTISGNLLVANKAQGIDVRTDNNGSQTIVNNTVTGNGVGANGTRETAAIDVVSDNNVIDRNVVSANYGAGVMIGSSGTSNRITRNSIYANGTITNDAGGAASGQIGIDLLSTADDANQGTTPFYSLNDAGDGDTGGNARLNTPVIDTATIVGANLELTGWITAGATAEFFISDEHASGFGSGRTFIGSFVEGGGSDLDTTTGSHSGIVNCFSQGTDSNVARFKFVMVKPAPVVAGTKLTATATSTTNSTSEFCGNTTIYTNLPNFTIVQSSQTISDPINTATNPKSIPGGVAEYTVLITNSNAAISDLDTFTFTEPVPANAAFFVGNLGGAGSGPVAFANGAVASGLVFTFTSLASTTDDLEFSRDGGATWTYTPVPDASGFDSSVTHVRITPAGSFVKATCGNTPSCSLRFRIRVQ